jgi:hypothetical protein
VSAVDSLEFVEKLRACYGLPIPSTHPTSGAEFVRADVEIESGDEAVRLPPPIRPTRMTCDGIDDDGVEINPRELTEEEYAAAVASYENAVEKYVATGGVYYTKGPTTVRLKLFCANGASAEYVGAPGVDGGEGRLMLVGVVPAVAARFSVAAR